MKPMCAACSNRRRKLAPLGEVYSRFGLADLLVCRPCHAAVTNAAELIALLQLRATMSAALWTGDPGPVAPPAPPPADYGERGLP